MAVEMDVVEHLGDLLDCGDTKSVKSIINEDKFDQVLQERANDLIPTAAYYLTKETEDDKPRVFRYSERIVIKCAENGNPKECLMEFLAQIESLDEVKLKTLLKPIQTVMLRIPDRKAPLMQCVLNVFHSFINSLPLPEYHHLDSNSKLLLDCDENAIKIRDIYQLLVEFYKPFVDEASVKCSDKGLRRVVLQALYHLLGGPLVFLDLEFNDKGSSGFRALASNIWKCINTLQSDLLQFLTLVEDKQLVTIEEEKQLIKEFSSNEIKYSNLSLASFFYLIFTENMPTSFPCVYDKLFIVLNCLSLAVTLLQYKERMVLRKGLLLTKVAVDKVDAGALSFSQLACSVHKEVLEMLAIISIHHDVEEDRKLAIELVRQYFFMFEPKAQFHILLNINKIASHPNIIGFFTTVLTKIIQNVFTDGAMQTYFTGKRLFDLLKIFCSLKKGAETDLIESKEQILPALNLLIFLTKRDRANFTGVWDYADRFSENFLHPLREGIKLSRAHFKLELDKLNDPVKNEGASELTVRVGREEMNNMAPGEKKEVINSGLTVFDLIEYVLCRATDSIEDKPSFSS